MTVHCSFIDNVCARAGQMVGALNRSSASATGSAGRAALVITNRVFRPQRRVIMLPDAQAAG
jgi:hypothetical protein